MKNKFLKISAVFLTVLIILSSFLIPTVSAAETVPEDIETSDVIKDLERMGIDYKKYKKDTSAEHCRMLKFLEYGYDHGGNQNEYGIYIFDVENEELKDSHNCDPREKSIRISEPRKEVNQYE